MDKLLKVFDGVSIGNLLTKDNAIKAFVLVMVLAFMLEMVSLGYLGGLSNGAASGPVANSSVPAVVYGTVI
ncbi:MAG TPA: hypothetical protein PLO51_02060, partial [Candidatus Micrarchaeota archaeon]|nr:hypothetical protein [Candidatus Micrarchaeota archaeon]